MGEIGIQNIRGYDCFFIYFISKYIQLEFKKQNLLNLRCIETICDLSYGLLKIGPIFDEGVHFCVLLLTKFSLFLFYFYHYLILC